MEKLKKVYLVDDDPDDRFLVCEAIKQVNPQLDIVEATDGQDFFEIFEKFSTDLPSLIVLDVNMPKMNGLETLQKIKSIPSLSIVPVIMYSTSNDPILIKQAFEVGIDDFIIKPSSFEGVIELASRITANYL